MRKKDLWYNGYSLLHTTDSTGKPPNVLISLSGRSYGKTTYWYNFLFKEALTLKKRFVLICRNKLDMNGIAQNFINSFWYEETEELMNDKAFFEIKNLSDGILKQILYNGEIIGHCVSISSANKIKSVSKLLEVDVGWSFFDEFITEDGHYITNETAKLNSILQSIYRAKPIRLILAANLISTITPLFTVFKNEDGLDIVDMFAMHPEAKKLKGVGWALEISEQSAELKKTLSENNRAFGASEYFAITISNEFKDDKSMIDKDISKLKRRTIGYFYTDSDLYKLSMTKDGIYYFEDYKGVLEENIPKYSLSINCVNRGVYIEYNAAIRSSMRQQFDSNAVRFDKLSTKMIYVDYIKY